MLYPSILTIRDIKTVEPHEKERMKTSIIGMTKAFHSYKTWVPSNQSLFFRDVEFYFKRPFLTARWAFAKSRFDTLHALDSTIRGLCGSGYGQLRRWFTEGKTFDLEPYREPAVIYESSGPSDRHFS